MQQCFCISSLKQLLCKWPLVCCLFKSPFSDWLAFLRPVVVRPMGIPRCFTKPSDMSGFREYLMKNIHHCFFVSMFGYQKAEYSLFNKELSSLSELQKHSCNSVNFSVYCFLCRFTVFLHDCEDIDASSRLMKLSQNSSVPLTPLNFVLELQFEKPSCF